MATASQDVGTAPSCAPASTPAPPPHVAVPRPSHLPPLRVTIWNRVQRRKIAGNAAPMPRNLARYLAEHPSCERYVDQDRLSLVSPARTLRPADRPSTGEGARTAVEVAVRTAEGGGGMTERDFAALVGDIARYLEAHPEIAGRPGERARVAHLLLVEHQAKAARRGREVGQVVVPAQSGPAKSSAEGRASVESVPGQSVPAQSVPTQSVLAPNLTTESVPSQSVPSQRVPAESDPAQIIPAQNAPARGIPGKSVPVQSVPVQSTPVQIVPVQNVPAPSVSAPTMPAESLPVQNVPVPSASLHAEPPHVSRLNPHPQPFPYHQPYPHHQPHPQSHPHHLQPQPHFQQPSNQYYYSNPHFTPAHHLPPIPHAYPQLNPQAYPSHYGPQFPQHIMPHPHSHPNYQPYVQSPSASYPIPVFAEPRSSASALDIAPSNFVPAHGITKRRAINVLSLPRKKR